MSAPSAPAPAAVPAVLSFDHTDRLGLKPFCQKLEKYLLVDSDYADGSLVTALNASFGGGKTTFLEMWKKDLLDRRDSPATAPAEEAFTAPMPVMLNAWESDYCGDPLVAILAGLLKALDDWKGEGAPPAGEKKALRNTANKIAWCGAALANDLVAKTTGMNAAKALEFAENQTTPKSPPIPDFIRLFEDRKKALHDLNEQMRNTFSGTSAKVIVFVDELDRCRPDYAVSYLETIKHVFNVKGMIFLLAVDLHHLEVSTKSLFGSDLKFNEYFRKFCHRTFHLPKPAQAPMRKLLAEYVTQYVVITGKRISRFEPNHDFNVSAAELAIGLEMTPRQVQEAFRIFGHVMSTQNTKNIGNILNSWLMGAIMLCYLRVVRNDLYQKILVGSSDYKALCNELSNQLGHKKATFWLLLYLTGIDEKRLSSLELGLFLKELGYIKDARDLTGLLGPYYQKWDEEVAPLQELCLMIESADNLE